MSQLATYSRFYSLAEAGPLLQLLDQANIAYEVEKEKDLLDKIYIGENMEPTISVQIAPADFEKVNALVEQQPEPASGEIHPEYYLYRFTDEELLQVLANPSEWNQFDRRLARQLLRERNVDTENIKPRAVPEYQPARLNNSWLLIEYLLAAAVPFAGIVIGLSTLFAFKTLPDGRRVNMYDSPTRGHASVMMLIGILRSLYYLAPLF